MIEKSHRRLNILTGEWILVSPHRIQRPWQGKVEEHQLTNKNNYDENCYLCPGNKRLETINQIQLTYLHLFLKMILVH